MLSARMSGIAVAVALLSGCAADATSEGEVGTASSAILGQDTYLYYRCNATSWDADDESRLRPTEDPYVFSLIYDVNLDWIKNGDSCQFVETNALNGWGSKQTYYGAVHGTVNVPGGDYLQTGGGNFSVKYPELGRHKVTVNWMQGMFQISPASGEDIAKVWQPCGKAAVTTVAQAPQAASNVLVGCSNGDVFLTFNGSSFYPSWTKVDSWNTAGGSFGLPDLPVNSIAYSPSDTKTAYLSVAGSKQGHKLWKTSTGGHYWSELSSVPLAEIWSISVNPLDTQKVYVFGPGGAFMSPDGGSSWTADVTAAPLAVPLAPGSELSTVSVAAGNRDLVWVGATNGDIFYTRNATTAQTWVKATHGMPERAVTHLTIETTRLGYPPQPTIYATFDGMYDDSVWVTSNDGFGWAILHEPNLPTTPMPLPGIYAFYGVSPNPVVNTVLYINGTYGAGISTTGGTSWSWASN